MARLLLFVAIQGETWDVLTKVYLAELRYPEKPIRAGMGLALTQLCDSKQ